MIDESYEECPVCGAPNDVRILGVDNTQRVVSECETMCQVCLHKNYWIYGCYKTVTKEMQNG